MQPDSAGYQRLCRDIATHLRQNALDIAIRWSQRLHSVTPRTKVDTSAPDGKVAVALILGIANMLTSEEPPAESSVALSIYVGLDAFASGINLHEMLKRVDLLATMILYSAESALSGQESTTFHAVHGLRLGATSATDGCGDDTSRREGVHTGHGRWYERPISVVAA